MVHSKSYRYRLMPEDSQKEYLKRAFGSSRFVYNHFLALKKSTYENSKQKISANELSRKLTELKGQSEFSWLYSTPAVCLQQSLRNLDSAYSRFFKGQNRFPRFKKKTEKQSVRFTKDCFRIRENGQLKITGLNKPLKIVWDRQIPEGAEISSITISKNPAGQFFVSFCTEHEIQAKSESKGHVGIDLGLNTFAVLSNGEEIPNLRFGKLRRSKLKTLQRRHTRTQKGSKNREKARLRLAKEYGRISDRRANFLHQQTAKIIRKNQTIVLETLRVKNMMQNHRLASAIADVSWSEFVRQLEYKARWYGRELILISSRFPSTHLCSACGKKREEKLLLSQREWTCCGCGAHHNRDLNAAKNILSEGLRSKTGGSPGIVCGGRVGEQDPESCKPESSCETEIDES